MEKTLHVGLDVGSTTVKIVVMDENFNIIHENYQRHFSDTKNTICNVLIDLANMYPNNKYTVEDIDVYDDCSFDTGVVYAAWVQTDGSLQNIDFTWMVC